MNKKAISIVLIIIIIALAGWFFIYRDETAKVEPVAADIQAHIDSKAKYIKVAKPLPNQTISSPVIIEGEAVGNWFFEASFPIAVVDWDGKIIGEGHAEAIGDWMTTKFVPFTATVTFTVDDTAYSNRGTLILKKDNPSGLSEHDDALEIPVVLK
jgi:hypothetical protein